MKNATYEEQQLTALAWALDRVFGVDTTAARIEHMQEIGPLSREYYMDKAIEIEATEIPNDHE